MFYLYQFRDIVRCLDQCRRGISSGHHQLNLSPASVYQIEKLFLVEQVEKNGVKDFVADEQLTIMVNSIYRSLISLFGVTMVNGLGTAGHDKWVFARAPVVNIFDLFENIHLRRISGFQELYEINPGAFPRSSNGQTDSPGSFPDSLAVIYVKKPEPLGLDYPGPFLCIKNVKTSLIRHRKSFFMLVFHRYRILNICIRNNSFFQ